MIAAQLIATHNATSVPSLFTFVRDVGIDQTVPAGFC
jgi:hypothetical protein